MLIHASVLLLIRLAASAGTETLAEDKAFEARRDAAAARDEAAAVAAALKEEAIRLRTSVHAAGDVAATAVSRAYNAEHHAMTAEHEAAGAHSTATDASTTAVAAERHAISAEKDAAKAVNDLGGLLRRVEGLERAEKNGPSARVSGSLGVFSAGVGARPKGTPGVAEDRGSWWSRFTGKDDLRAIAGQKAALTDHLNRLTAELQYLLALQKLGSQPRSQQDAGKEASTTRERADVDAGIQYVRGTVNLLTLELRYLGTHERNVRTQMTALYSALALIAVALLAVVWVAVRVLREEPERVRRILDEHGGRGPEVPRRTLLLIEGFARKRARAESASHVAQATFAAASAAAALLAWVGAYCAFVMVPEPTLGFDAATDTLGGLTLQWIAGMGGPLGAVLGAYRFMHESADKALSDIPSEDRTHADATETAQGSQGQPGPLICRSADCALRAHAPVNVTFCAGGCRWTSPRA